MLIDGLAPVASGTAVGVIIGLVSVRVLASYLFEVSATDAVTFIGAPSLLAVVAAIAASLPAGRAARLAPLEVLRTE